MSIHDHSHSGDTPPGSFLTSRAGLAFLGFAIIAGALLFTEHRAYVLGVLIWLPLLACPFKRTRPQRRSVMVLADGAST